MMSMSPNNPRDGTVSTTLTNPGIVNRLERDIADYLSPFGFRLERTAGDSGAAILVAPRHPDGPIGTLHLHVHAESLLPTVGPLLRTYLRLSPSHVHPLRYRAVVHCNFVLDALLKFDRMSSEQKRTQLQRQEEASARRMAHHVHMLVRNSMGSALCMELIVILPCYRKRTMHDGVAVDAQAHLTVDSVRLAMREGPEANYYPSVQLVEPGENGAGKAEGDCNATLHLDVGTRMCTVRHQPELFRWLSSLQCPKANGAATNGQPPAHNSSPSSTPLVVVCIEKVGNLHRILMLCHDYDKTRCGSFLSNVVVVLPTANGDGMYKPERAGKSKTLRDFEDAVGHFHKTIIGLERGNDNEASEEYRPSFVYEDEAKEKICNIIQQRRTPSAESQCIVGVDLHPEALTLNGDYATTKSQALDRMRKADAIVFGYESTGIPQALAEDLTDWVAIPSRSSINVVAALSIILDALLGSGKGDG